MPVFSGRIEAKYVVPTGGAAVSVSTGALSGAVTATLPAASYYHTAAGGVSSGITALQTAINAAVTPYPQTAAAMAAAVGYGTWTNGSAWLMQETTGNLAPTFGAVTLTVSSAPAYSTTGPGHGDDKAITMNEPDLLTGGDTFDATGADDLIVAWVGRVSSTSSFNHIVGKGTPGTAQHWSVYTQSDRVRFRLTNASVAVDIDATTFTIANEWYVGIAAIDRAAGTARVGFRGLTTGTAAVSANTATAALDHSNASNLLVGKSSGFGAQAGTQDLAGLYMVAGSGVAAGLPANLSTALSNFANAISSSFAVANSTSTGLTTISNSFYPCSVDFTSTTLRDVLGYAYNVDYPQTAAQLQTALGYGTWTSGSAWLCNESSGDLAPVFGSVTLADASSPTYSNLGPRGGSDKAVGFNSNADSFGGGDVFDVTGTDDLVLLWVGHHTATPTDTIISKYDGGNTLGYAVSCASGDLRFQAYNGATTTATASSLPVGKWYTGIVVIDRSTGKMRSGHCAIGASPTVSSETTIAANSSAHAVGFALGASTWLNGTTDMRLAYVAAATGSGVATGLSSNLSTALGNFAAYMKSQTSTEQAEGLWYPDAPLTCDDHPSMAPRMSDLRTSQSPTGVVLGLSGNTFFKHTGVAWQRVPVDRIREASATYANASLEVFWEHTQLGLGPSWFSVSSPVQVYWSNAGVDTLLGADETITGWTITGAGAVKDIARPSQRNWVGAFDVTLPALIASGS